MSAQSKIDNKAVFTSGARPGQTAFANLIDSYTQFSELLEYIGTAISNQTGILEIVSASATTHAVLPLDKGGTGEASLASAQNALATGGFAVLASANTFTNDNTFTQNITVSGDVIVSGDISVSGTVVLGSIYSVNASGASRGADTINVSQIFDDGEHVEATVLDTPQDTSTGTTFTFTAPFATITRAIVIFDEVSTDDTDDLLIQLGDSGGVETSGYLSTSTEMDDSTDQNDSVNSTAGFIIARGASEGDITSGTMELILSNSTNNTWISSHAVKLNAGDTCVGGGSKAALDTVLTTITLVDTGSDNFDAGEVNVRWYGY